MTERGPDMEIYQIAIYESIEQYLDRIPVVPVNKGEYVVREEDGNTKNRYYILSGRTRVIKNVDGRKVCIDEIGADEFTGGLSRVYNQELKCDVLATEDAVLLELEDAVFEELLKDMRFARIFYYKTSQRVYKMYKRMLLNQMFSQTEILAAYILYKQKDGKCVCPNMNVLCENLGFSRRNLYNALNNMLKSGEIEKKGHNLHIKNDQALKERGVHVFEYISVNYKIRGENQKRGREGKYRNIGNI